MSSDGTLPPIASASASACGSESGDSPAGAGAASPAADRPSGRRSVKARFIGVTATNVRRGVPPPAPHTQLVHSLQLDPYNAYFGRAVPVPPTLLAAAATAAAEAEKQKKKMGRPRAATLANSGPLHQPSASVSTTPSGSLSARTAPVAGRRAGASATGAAATAAPSGSATARVAVAIPRARSGASPGGQSEEEKSAQPPSLLTQAQVQMAPPQLPEWLRPRTHAAYPPPQAPLSPVPGARWNPPGADASHTAAAEGGDAGASRFSPAPTLPSTHSFQFYSPLSAPVERHQCAGAPAHPQAKQYIYAHRQQQQTASVDGTGRGRGGSSRSHSPHRHRAPGALGQISAGGDAAPAGPEVWSSWPFVNPRLVVAPSGPASGSAGAPVGGSAGGEEKESSGSTAAPSSSSSAPPLPVVPRLFGSVVSEQDRTLVFEYLRSTHSRLIQWPPQEGEQQQQAANDASGAAVSSLSPSPPLPLVTFTEAQLSRLIEEGLTAGGAIVLLRRLDAELAQASQAGTLGKSAHLLLPSDAPSAMVDAARPRPPPQHYSSAAELVAAVVATRSYLDTLRREMFRWICARDGGLGLFGGGAGAAVVGATGTGAAPAALKPTVFITQQMMDALVADASVGGLSEEELWLLLARWNTAATAASPAAAAAAAAVSAPGPMEIQRSPSFVGFEQLMAAVRAHASHKRMWALNPAAGAAIASANMAAGAGSETTGASAAPGSAAAASAAFVAPVPMLLDPSMALTAAAPLSPASARHAASSLSYARLLLFKFLRDDSAPSSGASGAAAAAAGEDDGRIGNGSGGGAALFAHAKDVTASMAQMDALIESTRALTLGQNYHALPAMTAATPAATPRGLGSSRPHSSPSGIDGAAHAHGGVESLPPAPSRSTSTIAPSRLPTRPSSPVHDHSVSSGASAAASSSPTSSPRVSAPSIAASTRAYGSFLAARTVRVLRSLLFQGQTYRSFDELIHATHAHTRKLRLERIKVFQFLTGQHPVHRAASSSSSAADKKKAQSGVTAAAMAAAASAAGATGAVAPAGTGPSSALGTLPAPPPDGPPSPELVAALQALTRSNASGAGGIFDAYYVEAHRRERARLAQEQQRAQQQRLNTHQYGSSHHLHGHASTAQLLSYVPPSRPSTTASNVAVAPPDRSFRGGGGGGKGAQGLKPPSGGERRRPSRHMAVPSHIFHNGPGGSGGGGGAHSRNPSKLETAHFDWALDAAPPAVATEGQAQHSSGGSDPAAIRASAQASGASSSNGGLAPLNSSTITRYASAKTLPYTASKSLLLKHADALAPSGLPVSAAGGDGGTQAPIQQLPPLLVTPELVDAIFGGMDHLLTLGVADAAPVAAPTSPAPAAASAAAAAAPSSGASASSPGALSLPAAPTAVFDPLLEQADEDFLLETEPEDAYNSMDLTLLLQQFKATRPAEEDEEAAGKYHHRHRHRQHQQQQHQPSYLSAHPLYKPMLEQAKKHVEDAKKGSTAEGEEEEMFVVRSATRRRASTTHTAAPAGVLGSAAAPKPYAPGTTQQPEDPLNPSSSTAIPTLESLLNPQQQEQEQQQQAQQQQPQQQQAPEASASPAAGFDAPSFKLVAVESTVTVLQPRSAAGGGAESELEVDASVSAPAASSDAQHSDDSSDATSSASSQALLVRAPSSDSFLLSPASPAEEDTSQTKNPVLSIAIEEAAPAPHSIVPVAVRAPDSSVTTVAGVVVAATSAAAAAGSDAGAPPPAMEGDAAAGAAAVPKMLPVVWQTMQILRDQGKIKLHNSSPAMAGAGSGSGAASASTGPAGAGAGSSLGPFIPNCGPVIPGGSMGSIKTLAILRELSAAKRAFFSVQALVATVCSMRAERKWAKRAANAEKKKLLAAGITIAQPSGVPNEIAAPHILPNYGSMHPPTQGHGHGPHRRGPSTLSSPRGGAMASSSFEYGGVGGGISSVQFQLLTAPQSLAGRSVRQVTLVDEEAEEARLAQTGAEAAAGGAGAGGAGGGSGGEEEEEESGGSGLQSGTWGSESQRFLPPSAFPSSLHMPAYPAPPPSSLRDGQGAPGAGAAGSIASSKRRHQRDESGTFAESEARAWARARLLAHLSTLLLLRPDAPAEGGPAPAPLTAGSPSASSHVDVQIRMGELESLLDALASGPREALAHAEKLARREREALERAAATAPLGSASGDAALAALASLPPPGHPLAPLLALLSAMDATELAFPDMATLCRSVQQGAWTALLKQAERRKQRTSTMQQPQQQQQQQQHALGQTPLRREASTDDSSATDF